MLWRLPFSSESGFVSKDMPQTRTMIGLLISS